MNKKKKVLFITNIPAPYRVDFYNELGKKVDLTVIFEAKGASNQGIRFNWNLDSIQNFEAIFLSDGDIRERKIDFRIFKYLKKNRYDEIVATNYSYFTEMVALLYLKIMRIPYYMETDGGLIKPEENILKKLYKRFLVSGAKGYFSPSKESDSYLIYYGAKKNRIYRYPFTSIKDEDIIPEVLSNNEKKEYKNRLGMNESIIILGVGQFIYRKGWDILLEAANLLPKNIGFYIVGSDATSEYLKKKSEYGLDNVHFSGFKTKTELEDYYRAADIFVLPTREDIWGLVVNEAISFGLPVITTDKCNAGLELIAGNDCGAVIKADDVNSLKESIESMVSMSPDRMLELRKNALKVGRKYSIEEMAEIHKEIFSKMSKKT